MSNFAYQQLLARLAGTIKSLGLQTEEKAGWVVLTGPKSGHRVAIQKSKTKLPKVETSLEIPVENDAVIEEIENGRMCRLLMPTPAVVETALRMIADPGMKIRDRKRGGSGKQVKSYDELLAAEGYADPSEDEGAEEEQPVAE